MSRTQRIHDALFNALIPEVLTIEDETHQHHVAPDAESHFKIILVSTQFIGQARLARHRLVNSLLANEFQLGLHALSLHLFTPAEWERHSGNTSSSPLCRGGKWLEGHDH